MKTLKLAVIAVLLILGATTFAQEEHKMKFEVIVMEDGVDGTTSFSWSGDDADFDMQDMQVGESRSIIDDSGRSVLITRETDGFKIDVDGKTIMMPGMGIHGAHMAFVEGGGDMDIDVQVIGHGDFTIGGGPAGVTIISEDALDESTKASIRAVLQSAGRDDEVTFIDGSGSADGNHVKIIRKKVEVVH